MRLRKLNLTLIPDHKLGRSHATSAVHARNSEVDGIPTTSIPKLGIQCSRNSVQVAHGIPTRAHVPLTKRGSHFHLILVF